MKSIQEDIKNNDFKNVYLLYGEEEYLKIQYRDRLCKALLGEGDTMNLTTFSGKGASVGEIIDLGQTMPFLSERRVIVVEESGFFKSQCPELADYMGELPDYLHLVFVEKEIDKRNRLYKAVTKAGRAVEFGSQDVRTLTRWVLGMIGKENKRITQNDMEHFLVMTGSDMRNIENETKKLLDYTMGREIITREDIDEICSTQITNQIFAMVEAVTNKQQKKALKLYYDLLALKEPPMRILFLMARQFNHLLQVKALMGHGNDDASMAKKIGVQPFVIKKYKVLAKQYSSQELHDAVEEFTETEAMVKTGRIQDVLSVELLIIKYSA